MHTNWGTKNPQTTENSKLIGKFFQNTNHESGISLKNRVLFVVFSSSALRLCALNCSRVRHEGTVERMQFVCWCEYNREKNGVLLSWPSSLEQTLPQHMVGVLLVWTTSHSEVGQTCRGWSLCTLQLRNYLHQLLSYTGARFSMTSPCFALCTFSSLGPRSNKHAQKLNIKEIGF